MRLLVYAVKDMVANCYGNPFMQVSRGAAIRSFGDTINRGSGEDALNLHPEHFTLNELGTYDDNTGLYDTHAPVQVAHGKDLVISKS